MGIGVSGWRLARTVSQAGQLGVVSGTSLDSVLIRRLQLGDPDGHVRRALDHFPVRAVAERIISRYFISGGKAADVPFARAALPGVKVGSHVQELLVAGNFVEVFLAKEGHDQPVGINYLEKLQLQTLASVYGAMLAGVSWVLMGAGIPRTIPGIIDQFSDGQAVSLRLDVKGTERGEEIATEFDPVAFCEGEAPSLARPNFVPIIASETLAAMLMKRSSARLDGFIVEGPTAGGHNAPPRGKLQLSEAGEPVYGERDVPKLEAIRDLGLPFWLAGSCAEPEHLAAALEAGAAGIQVGTAFAYCDESDLRPDLKRQVLEASRKGTVRAFTDPIASPAGFPFKVVQLEDTLSEGQVYEERMRICDLGYLRHGYKKSDGSIGWRCPAEPLDDYVKKGGEADDTRGRKCICNALMANIGLGQLQRDGEWEKALITSGDDVASVARFVKPGAESYSANDVLEYLLRDVNQGQQEPADA